MAYNYFPAGYQPMQYYPQAVQPAGQQNNQAPQQNNSIIWVQGEAGAKSYLVAPNSSVALWDSESQTVYIKSADASGMPSMRVLDYTFRSNAPEASKIPAQSNFATKDDLDTLREELQTLRAKVEEGADKK